MKYLTHDAERERPVHFAWQLLDWPIPQDARSRIGLRLEGGEQLRPGERKADLGLIAAPVPSARAGKAGSSTRQFKTRLNASTAESDQRKRDVGLAGELAVLDYEIRRLRALGLGHLADQVRHVSVVEGDGAGYDILSFREDSSKLYIEVKTTNGNATSEFLMSSNEVAFAAAHAASFELRRVYAFDERTQSGHFHALPGNAEDHLSLSPTQFRASLR